MPTPPLPPSQRPLSSGVPDVRERPRAAPDRMSEKRVEEAPAELSAKVRPPPAPPSRLAPARRARPTGRPLPAAPTARPTEGRARPSANGERGRGARGPARGIPLSEVGGGGGGGAARRGAGPRGAQSARRRRSVLWIRESARGSARL